jgi:tetratricopeptide (TPR) repeat protein
LRLQPGNTVLAAITLACACFAQTIPNPAEITDDLEGARAYADKGKLPEAESAVRQFLKTHRDSAKGHFLLGHILFRAQKARESLAEMTEGAKFQKPTAVDLRVVGTDYVLLRDYADADKWFTRASEWDPENVLGWYYLARTKYNENRFEEAVKAFEQCLKLDPRHVRASDNLGLSFQALGRSDEARQAFLNAIAWQSDAAAKDPWPYIDLGSFLVEQNHPEEALRYLQEAVRLAPDSPKAHEQLGKAFLALEQLDKAQAELEAAVKLEPQSPRAHYVLGQLYAKHGESDKAKSEFGKYSQLNAQHPSDEREIPNVTPN